jgi:hypothetical protein
MKPGDGTPGPGRPKGRKNRATVAVREMVLEALARAGGAEFFYRLATSRKMPERIAFANIAGRFVPIEVSGHIDHGLTVIVKTSAGEFRRELPANTPLEGTCTAGDNASRALTAAPIEGEIVVDDQEPTT